MSTTVSPTSTSKPVPRALIYWLLVTSHTVFLTRVGIVPGVANNIGPFELSVGLLVGITLLYFAKHKLKIHGHFLVAVLGFITLIATLNLFKLTDRLVFGLTQWFLLVYALALLLIFYNWLIRYPDLLRHLLRFLSYAAAIAAIFVAIDGFLSGGDPNASGLFRNRAHVSIYLLSSFWLILLYINYPGVSRREQLFFNFCLLIVLYGIAVAGRRSVYLSLAAGIFLLAISSLFYFRQAYGRVAPILLLSIGLFAFLYLGQDLPFLPSTSFFRERVGTVEQRLRAFSGDEDVIADSDNFILLQRQGMWQAVRDYPILGIGWGAFHNSPYSPTGHEMHSTPQRFLAELGVVGFSLYLVLTFYLLFSSLRLLRLAKGQPTQMPILILFIAFVSLHISWFYNRSVTDRTYWLLLVILMGFEQLVQQRQPRPLASHRHASPHLVSSHASK